jgi:hypothetical protein
MAFNVSNETKIELLNRRLESLNLEGYQHELNKRAAEASGDEEAVTKAAEAIAIIEAAIEFAQSELDNLNA